MSIPPNIIADRLIPCPVCLVDKNRACLGLEPNTSHFGRRLKRILTMGSLPAEKIAAIRSEIQNELQSKNAGNGSTGSEPNKSG